MSEPRKSKQNLGGNRLLYFAVKHILISCNLSFFSFSALIASFTYLTIHTVFFFLVLCCSVPLLLFLYLITRHMFFNMQDVLKLRKEGKSIRSVAQTLCLWPIQEFEMAWKSNEKQPTGALSNRHQTGRPRTTAAVDEGDIVRAVKKNTQITVSGITTQLHGAGVKVSQCNVQIRVREPSCKPLVIRKSQKVRTEFAKRYRVMERLKYLLVMGNMQAHLWRSVQGTRSSPLIVWFRTGTF